MSDALLGLRRSLEEFRLELIAARLEWLSRQEQAEAAGNAAAAAHCLRKLARAEAQLRAVNDALGRKGAQSL